MCTPLPISKAKNGGYAENKPQRKAQITIELLKGGDAHWDKASIKLILGRCPPRRVMQGKRATYVDEFMV
jgi:hypothetical protein